MAPAAAPARGPALAPAPAPVPGAALQAEEDVDEGSRLEANLREVRERWRSAAFTPEGQDWVAAFDAIDSDGDGELDLKEFQRLLRTVLQMSEQDISDEGIVALFRSLDTDSNTALTLDETLKFLELDQEKADVRWIRGWDVTHKRFFYFNTGTCRSSWHKPKEPFTTMKLGAHAIPEEMTDPTTGEVVGEGHGAGVTESHLEGQVESETTVVLAPRTADLAGHSSYRPPTEDPTEATSVTEASEDFGVVVQGRRSSARAGSITWATSGTPKVEDPLSDGFELLRRAENLPVNSDKRPRLYESALDIFDHVISDEQAVHTGYNSGNDDDAVSAEDRENASSGINMSRAYYGKGCALHNLQRHEAGAVALSQSLKQDSAGRKGAVWNELGLVKMDLGAHQEAVECFNNALERDQDNVRFQINLQAAQGRLDTKPPSPLKGPLKEEASAITNAADTIGAATEVSPSSSFPELALQPASPAEPPPPITTDAAITADSIASTAPMEGVASPALAREQDFVVRRGSTRRPSLSPRLDPVTAPDMNDIGLPPSPEPRPSHAHTSSPSYSALVHPLLPLLSHTISWLP